MVTVGQGADGTVELQNILFTSQGALPGLVLVQWNIKAKTQGSVGMWGELLLKRNHSEAFDADHW
jgi:glucan 1,3-beta-glucosidase